MTTPQEKPQIPENEIRVGITLSLYIEKAFFTLMYL